jgi:ubiquinone/menaquinone biosynthesis C-methylase UbiE
MHNVPGNYYNKHESRNPIVSHLMRRFHGGVVEAVRSVNPASILDVGCGEGRTTEIVGRAVDARVVGMDLESVVVEDAARSVAGASFVVGSALNLPFEDHSFDLVLATEVLEHLDQPRAALEEMLRVARRALLVTVPHEPWWRLGNMARLRYIKDLGNTPGHVQHWSRSTFERFLQQSGTKVRVDTVGLWLLGTVDL